MSARRAVIKVGGGLLLDDAALGRFCSEVAGLIGEGAWEIALVHGGGSLIDARLESIGHVSERVGGLRLTPPRVMEDVVSVLRGSASSRLCSALRASGCAPVGLSLSDGSTVRVSGTELEGVGAARCGDTWLVGSLWGAGCVPVFACCGMDVRGAWMNVNGDDAAAAMAGTLGADALLLLSDVAGVAGADGELMEVIDDTASAELSAQGVIRGGMEAKVRAALHASDVAGCCVRIASWSGDATLAPILDGEGGGTVVRRTIEGARRPSAMLAS